MNFADRVKESTTSTNSATLTLTGAPTGYRTFASAFATNTAGIPVMTVDTAGSWELSVYTFTAPNTLTRESVLSSSNANSAVTAWNNSAKEVFCTVPSAFLQTVTMDDIANVDSMSDSYEVVVNIPGSGPRMIRFDVFCTAVQGKIGSNPPADSSSPELSSATATATGTTTATGSVSTNEGNGTLYYAVTVNASETAATVKAGQTQVVSATGVQNVSLNSLTQNTTYRVHFLHRDAAGNDSAVLTSGTFTTQAVGDTTAPLLSAPTATQTGQNTANGSVTTNEGNGTLYRYVSTNGTETAATVKAANLTSAVTASGLQNVSFAGLTAGTPYYAHYVHRDAAGNDSAVATSAQFTTASATPSTMADTYRLTNTNSAGMSGGTTYPLTLNSGDYQGNTGSYTKTSDSTVVPALNVRVNVRDASGNPLLQAPKFAWGILGEAAPATFSDTALAIGANGIATGRGNGLVTTTRLGSWGDTATTSGQYGTYQVGATLYSYVGQSVPSANGRNGTVPMVLWVLFPDGSRKMHDNNQGQGNPIVYYFTTNAL